MPPVFLNCPDSTVLFCDYTNNDPAQYGNKCEGPVDLSVKVVDDCSGTDITLTYLLSLDLDGNGSMETFISSSMPNAWPIEKTIMGDTVCGTIKLPPGVGLPYGTHKVEWIAADGCGNQSICKYDFATKDCKEPTVVCVNGLSVNIMPTGMITLWASDFLKYAYDNCTPDDLLKIAIRKAGTGTGFPFGNTSVTFDCNEIGQQEVEVWAEDECGNGGFCITYVIIQDHFGACTAPGPVSGTITNDQQQALKGAHVLLQNNLQPATQFITKTDAQGNYAFAGAPGTCNYSIIPTLDTLPLNGVNTMDVMLTDWHISGTQALPTPYRIIAVDANADGVVDTDDLDVMGDLITGVIPTFPNSPSWRFVPLAYSFTDPLDPLADLFPETISTTCPAPSGLNQHFVAMKTGDADGNANLIHSLISSPDDRGSSAGTVTFKMVNQRFQAGEEITAQLISPELSDMLGFQFTLSANPENLELLSAEPMLTAKTGAFPAQGDASMSWYRRSGESSGIRPVLKLRFKALANSSLKQSINFSSDITRAEAYDLGRQPMGVELEFAPTKIKGAQAKLLPPSPNPTTGPFTAQFYVPQEGNISLILSNLNGGAISTYQEYAEEGWHSVEMPVNGKAVTGVHVLHLQTEYGTEVQRVMLQR